MSFGLEVLLALMVLGSVGSSWADLEMQVLFTWNKEFEDRCPGSQCCMAIRGVATLCEIYSLDHSRCMYRVVQITLIFQGPYTSLISLVSFWTLGV